jgi:type VI secretion system (T6SS) phospholipase Tle1-like effector
VIAIPKNIIIFSDGTGQAGGITFVEVRTNIYKLYRACRIGPDTSIDPSAQVAFYDPGLGSPADPAQTMADDIEAKWQQKLSSAVARAISVLFLLVSVITAAPECRAEDTSNPPATTGSQEPAADQTPAGQPPSGEKQTEKEQGATGQTAAGQTPSGKKKGAAATHAPALQETIPDCAGKEEFKTLANTTNSSAIVYNGNLLPAGNTVDFGLTTALDPNAHYFALLLGDNTTALDNTTEHGARARKASEADDLVVKHLLSSGQTIVSYDVPRDAAGFWTKRNLYIYQCDLTRRPLNVSYLPVYVSPIEWSIVFTLFVGLAVYYAAARAFRIVSGQTLAGHQSWNPIRITAGADNRGSLSTLQVFFFTVLVFVMLAYVLMRTGVLSDLSTTVLELLGISGLGATAAKGADSSKTAIEPVNQAWLESKGWYNAPSVRVGGQPTFYDLISSDGNFDVYRYQSFLFSAAVGGALFIGGISQLSSFTVPQNILGILGLSQVVYIAGKLVGPNTASQINAVITDLRNAEAEFRQAALTNNPPAVAGAAAAAAPPGPPTTLQDAINRAGANTYAAYINRATAAAALFTKATGLAVNRPMLEPSYSA